MTRNAAALGLCLGLIAGPAMAQVETVVDVEPDWRRKPSREDLFGVWPREAMKRGDGGTGVIHCNVSAQGGLFGCKVVSEQPAGSGFGAAAIALTPQFLMTPAMKGGRAVAYDGVTIPVKFASFTPVTGGEMKTVVSNVSWAAAPTYAEVAAAFPTRARERRVGGQATLRCTVRDQGRIGGCFALGETPRGLGFGSAAQSLVSYFRSPVRFGDKDAKGALVQLSIAFPAEMLEGGAPVVGKPQWIAAPSAEALQAAIPASAGAAGVTTARVVMTCTILPDGALGGCVVDREEPVGHGFGAATVALSPAFRLSIWTNEGLPTIGAKVTVPIRYEIPAAKP
jgi:TonB family protein